MGSWSASRSSHRAPSPAAGCQGEGGILPPPPPGVPAVPGGLAVEAPAWAAGGSGPAFARAGHIWPARGPARAAAGPEGACLRRAVDAEQGRPGRTEADLRPALEGPEGLGGRAVAVARCSGTGPGAGQSGGGRSAGPRGGGRCLWRKFPALPGWPLKGVS